MNRWQDIEAFVRVAASESFTTAAGEMGVSKSHISRRISALEDRLNAQLLRRTTRSVSLTEVGRAFYLRCRDILSTMNDAEQAVIDMQEKPRGSLRVSVSGAFGEEFIAPAALSFMAAHPEMRIELDFNNRLVDLVSEGYDIAIRSGTLKDSSLIARRIASRKLLICASPGYFEHFGRPRAIHDLASHNCLVGTLSTWRFRENGRNFDLRVDGNWRSNNGRALLLAARRGMGLVQLPSFYLHDALEQGELETTLDAYRPTDTGVWALYPHNRHLSAKVRLFVNFLIDEFSEHVSVSAPGIATTHPSRSM